MYVYTYTYIHIRTSRKHVVLEGRRTIVGVHDITRLHMHTRNPAREVGRVRNRSCRIFNSYLYSIYISSVNIWTFTSSVARTHTNTQNKTHTRRTHACTFGLVTSKYSQTLYINKYIYIYIYINIYIYI